MIMVIVAVASVFAFNPSNAVNQKENKLKDVPIIPDTLQRIFQFSCMGCHGEGGNGLAMTRLNFSVWEKYSSKKQAKKANAICNVLSKGSMPPLYIRESTPQKVPTAAQVEMICDWAVPYIK